MKNVTPFKIEIAETVLTDLQSRIKKTRWTDEPENAGWSYGTNPEYLKELVEYWHTEYNWKKHEKELNKFSQFKTEIDGVSIHFIHMKGKGKNPKPLLLTHGWPDSFYRFHKVIPMLTDPASFGGNPNESFDVIVPSLPGFGFSGKTALSAEKTANILAKLMSEVLGYKTFFAAAGDLGTPITKSLAIKHSSLVKAIHLTDVGYPTGMEDTSSFSEAEKKFAETTQKWWFSEGAYNALQSTKPQTLGYALNDSPVGLASWILEKFNSWSDNKGNIESIFTKDELLTNIMIYWVTQTINPSIRTYTENMRAMFANYGALKNPIKVEVPTAVAVYPADTVDLPREWAERMVNVKQFSVMKKGGHFAAMEEPKLWVDDITTFFMTF